NKRRTSQYDRIKPRNGKSHLNKVEKARSHQSRHTWFSHCALRSIRSVHFYMSDRRFLSLSSAYWGNKRNNITCFYNGVHFFIIFRFGVAPSQLHLIFFYWCSFLRTLRLLQPWTVAALLLLHKCQGEFALILQLLYFLLLSLMKKNQLYPSTRQTTILESFI